MLYLGSHSRVVQETLPHAFLRSTVYLSLSVFHQFLIYSTFLTDEHLGCFLPFAVKNSASLNSLVHVSPLHFASIPLGEISRSEVTESNGKCIETFAR